MLAPVRTAAVGERGPGRYVRVTPLLRPIGAVLTVVCVGAALRAAPQEGPPPAYVWVWLAVAFALACAWQWRLDLPSTAATELPAAPSRWRLAMGAVLAAAGAAVWGAATRALYVNWIVNFDRGWIGWVGGAAALAAGLDLLWGRSQRRQRNRLWPVIALMMALVAVAAVFRLGNIASFPGEGYVSQIEDVQTGMWGDIFLHGGRARWEYLSWEWLAALGLWLGGPTQLAMRIPFAVASVLKTVPLFLWLRFACGPLGAVIGTGLFVGSSWDVILSRIPNNHLALVVTTAFALLAGPARRGRPSAYVWLGLLGGYVFYEYVAYRPLLAFILMGVTAFSLWDRRAAWVVRVARPLLTVSLIVSMAIPLFVGMLWGPRFWNEYFNGWNRARVQAPYYEPQAGLRETLTKRINRSAEAIGLFYFRGDPMLAHNLEGRPLVDPVTAILFLVGIAYGVMHPRRGVFGLTVLAFAVTLTGTLIVTGNFDVGRFGGGVPYTYALAGYGGAAVASACETAWGRAGRRRATVLLLGAVLVAGALNTRFLLTFWHAPSVRRIMRQNLVYLAAWLREHARPDEQVVGVGPNYFNVLQANDAAWVRGREMSGIMAWDVAEALHYWTTHRQPTLLVAFTEFSTGAVREYLEWLIPGLHLQLDVDPIGEGGDVAYAHVSGPPAALADRLAWARCRGAHGSYRLTDASQRLLYQVDAILPFIDTATWPAAARQAMQRNEDRARAIVLDIRGTFVLPEAGTYTLALETYAGRVDLTVDGLAREPVPAPLDAGPHTFQITGTFDALVAGPTVRLLWEGPATQGTRTLMPLYRLAEENPSCAVDGLVPTATAPAP